MSEKHICRVGQNHIHTVYMVGKLPNIRSYTVYLYGSGQPYIYLLRGVGVRMWRQ